MDFKKLGEVATVEEILDTDTVLVARDGQIYRADKSKVGGGAGGYLLEPADDEIVEASGDDSTFYITTKIDDMLLALEAGSPVSIRVDGKVLLGIEGATVTLIPGVLITGALVEEQGLALMAISSFITGLVTIGFTNGGPVPSTYSTRTASVNTVSAMASKLHDKPVVTEAADGVD